MGSRLDAEWKRLQALSRESVKVSARMRRALAAGDMKAFNEGADQINKLVDEIAALSQRGLRISRES